MVKECRGQSVNEASRREELRFRTGKNLDTSRAVLKDAANVISQSEVLGEQSRALSEELQQVCEQGRVLHESGRQRRAEWRGEQAMPMARTLAGVSPATAILDAYSLLEPLPGTVVI